MSLCNCVLKSMSLMLNSLYKIWTQYDIQYYNFIINICVPGINVSLFFPVHMIALIMDITNAIHWWHPVFHIVLTITIWSTSSTQFVTFLIQSPMMEQALLVQMSQLLLYGYKHNFITGPVEQVQQTRQLTNQFWLY